MYGLQREEGDRLTWDAATKKLASGGCAFESMNDSAFGELIAAGAKEGRDFGATTFPGTGDSFLAVVDVFVAATKAKNAKNALAFLGAISEPSTQLAFNRSKGSIPVDLRPDTQRGRELEEGPLKRWFRRTLIWSQAVYGTEGQRFESSRARTEKTCKSRSFRFQEAGAQSCLRTRVRCRTAPRLTRCRSGRALAARYRRVRSRRDAPLEHANPQTLSIPLEACCCSPDGHLPGAVARRVVPP
jgi:hypothetical protein